MNWLQQVSRKMDDLFGQIEYRSKSDVIVMRLLRIAMDKAHENVQSMNGPMVFLHERSKFYELAAILVEGGLNIVQEEAADIQETSREKIISDLIEIKNWLKKRNEEMRHLIMDKDKELLERIENELKLKEALELNETELEYLREKEEMKRSKIDDICSLKNSVDQQVWNIKQKLEYEERNVKNSSNNNSTKLVSNASDTELYAKLGSSFSMEDDDDHHHFSMEDDHHHHHFSNRTQPFFCRTLDHGKYNRMIRQMSSDIDILKSTFDVAFGRMQNAEFNNKNHFCCCYKKKWTGLVRDMTTLSKELKSLSSHRNKKGDHSSLQMRRTVSEPLPEILLLQTLEEENKKATGIQSVAKMIKSHETFIKKHSKASSSMFVTKEMPNEKKSSSVKRDKESDDELESRLKGVIRKFDKIIESNKKYQKVEIGQCDKKHVSSEMLLQFMRNDVSAVYMQELMREWKIYAECREEEYVLEEEIYKFVLKESVKCTQTTGNLLMKQVENKCSESVGSLIREDVQMVYFREMLKEWKTERDDHNIEMNIRKNVYKFLMTEMAKQSHAITITTPTSEPEILDQKSEIHRYESSIGDLDSVLDSAENEQNIQNWLLSAGEKLETVLHEVHTSKALLSMLDTENTMNNPQIYSQQDDDSCTKLNDIVAVATAEEHDEHEEDEMLQLYHSILTPLMGFQQILVDFENTTCTNLESKSMRIERLKQEVSELVQSVTSIKKRKLLYKKAFITRCKNLLLAENEVDLLGNQVDKLVCLLQKVYFILDQNSAVLSPYFKVFDMLNFIKKELAKESA